MVESDRRPAPLGSSPTPRRPSPHPQVHGEASAQHVNLAATIVGRIEAVLRGEPPAMGFDDLLGDGKTEPRILAEALLRPVGVEALEDLLERIRANAGAVVLDDD